MLKIFKFLTFFNILDFFNYRKYFIFVNKKSIKKIIMNTKFNILLGVLFLLVLSRVSFSQEHIPNVKNGNYKAEAVSVYIDGVRQGSKYCDVIFNFRDSILYTSSPNVFHDIVFNDSFEKYEVSGTIFKENKGYDDGNFSLSVNIAYKQGKNVSLKKNEAPWLIFIAYKDMKFAFHLRKTNEVLHRAEESIKMHKMYNENYTEEEINIFLKNFGFALF